MGRKIGVSPEMAKAGADVLLCRFIDGELTESDAEKIVIRIYEAMVSKSRPPQSEAISHFQFSVAQKYRLLLR